MRVLSGRILRHLCGGENIVGLVVNSKNGIFVVAPDDAFVGRRLREDGDYGQQELQRILNLVSADDRVLVVGSHIGALAIPIAKKVSHVTAIEANPDTFSLLQMNIDLNNLRNVTAIQIAANDVGGTIDFVMNRDNSGGSKRLPLSRPFKYFYDKPEILPVAAGRLDDVIEEKNFKLILMDIEGSEYFALKGMPEIISNAHILVVEFLPHHLAEVSGVTPEQFVDAVGSSFRTLVIPSKNIRVLKEEFLSVLKKMYDEGERDDGIIFLK